MSDSLLDLEKRQLSGGERGFELPVQLLTIQRFGNSLLDLTLRNPNHLQSPPPPRNHLM